MFLELVSIVCDGKEFEKKKYIISNLSQQNSNLQMDIDTAPESLSDSVESRPVLPSVSPSITALSIADELADRESAGKKE